MVNRLASETSPYLLQHAKNPVDWYPWGEAAFEKAHREDKPVFLSIGYAACHWCHVMAHESFEDPALAERLNRDFVSIKVDREERPDIDSIYMDATVAMTGQGGWPLSVFLTPEGQPFYAGTYFPPEPRYNMPSFAELLEAIARTWRDDRARVLRSGESVARHLRERAQAQAVGSQPLDPDAFDRAVQALIASYDREDGGWGMAPKFPQPMAIEVLLLDAATRGNQADSLSSASHALARMALGGLHDVVGGGFHRYSTDRRWLVPHFEKMLYDNAQLALTYLHAYLLTGDPGQRRVCERTLDFILRELSSPEGGFYSSLDADSGGEEGSYYVWTPEEIRVALGEAADFFLAAYGVSAEGNFEGKTVLQRALDDDTLAAMHGLTRDEVPARLDALHARLLKARTARIRPATDDKILTLWNALALRALAEAGRYLHDSRYLQAARANATFLLSALHPADRLLRFFRAGKASHNAYLEDYAGLIVALLGLYQSDPDPRWYAQAEALAVEMWAAFRDPAGGFFDTRADHETLLVRPRDSQDNATPSGGAQAAAALLLLDAYGHHPEWRAAAEAMIAGMQASIVETPTAYGYWLQALHFAVGPVRQVVLVGDAGSDDLGALAAVLWESYRPRLVSAVTRDPPADAAPELAHDRPALNGRATAYVCEGFVCRLPVTDAQALRDQL